MAKDEKEAVKWYTKAADQGLARGQCNLGVCYDNGTGVAKDEKEAVKWYTKAAEQGYTRAQLYLGISYQNGTGVIKDEKEAVKWYTKAAEQGNADAECNLGICYQNGTGVAKDEKEAVKRYEKAVALKNAKALHYLGRKLMTRDLPGISQKSPEYFFQELSSLPHRDKGSSLNYLIGMGSMESGAFLKAKEAFLLAGNQYGPTAQNIQPDAMRLTSPKDPWLGSILQILDDEGSVIGTGVFFGSDGWVFTAAHVVAGRNTLAVRDSEMNKWPVEDVCPGDFSGDLVLLKTYAKNRTGAELADAEPKVSEVVTQVGHPWGVLHSIVSRGKVENIQAAGNTYVCSLASMPGNSGSPVFNEDMELVGITSQGSYFIQSKSPMDLSRAWVVSLAQLKKMAIAAQEESAFFPLAKNLEWQKQSRFWSAEEGKRASSLLMGQTLLAGSYEARQPEKAAAIFVAEAEKGDTEGIYQLANMHYRGEVVSKDQTKALELWNKSADQGNTKAMLRLGAELHQGGIVPKNQTEALKWYLRAAEKGDAMAMAMVGAYYLSGWGTNCDYQLAEKWIRASAEKGNSLGQYCYGFIYERGVGVRSNPALAAKWYEEAAKNGSMDGMVKYGQCLEYGTGTRSNQVAAISWYLKAASSGNLDAQYRLAMAYSEGNGVDKNFPKALDLWKKCARQGHQDSIQKLSILGISPDD